MPTATDRLRIVSCCVLAALVCGAPPAETASDWVVSVKTNDSGGPVRARKTPGRYIASNINVKQLLMAAYGLRDYQIIGPGWIAADTYDIEAKREPAGEPAEETLGPMLQMILADRFQLKAHFEQRPVRLYALTVARGGAKMPAADSTPEPTLSDAQIKAALANPDALPPKGSMKSSVGSMAAAAISVDRLARFLSVTLQRPVLDHTGLTGVYDVRLHWAPVVGENTPFGPASNDTEVDPNRPSIFSAVQEQLGLRLESETGPVDVLIVDNVERPSAN